MSINRSQAFDIVNGEWTASSGSIAPICYRAGQPVSIKVKFTSGSTKLRSARIKADNYLGKGLFNSFSERTVNFGDGESDWTEFWMDGCVPSAVAIYPREWLHWTVTAVDDVPVPEETITNTGPHKAGSQI